jgi:hypothetical protein
MNSQHISALRLINQQIGKPQFNTAKEIVGWMGAVQAQDFQMAKWALGARLSNSTEQSIEKAFNEGQILRTHLLRPTWHFVSADDIDWMMKMSAPQIWASSRARRAQLGLTDELFLKSNRIIEKALANGNFLSRKELMTRLENAGIDTGDNRSAYIMEKAELDCLVCSGPVKGKELTYALYDERVTKKSSLTREEALGTLAQRYFTSHSPATLRDFLWWSGLYVADAKNALEMVKPMLVSEKTGEQVYWFSSAGPSPEKDKKSAFLLPAFDEYLISYKDRSAMITFEAHKKAVSNNGIFRPIVVLDGEVTGIWKKNVKKDTIAIEASFFEKKPDEHAELIEQAAGAFGDFLEKEPALSFSLV